MTRQWSPNEYPKARIDHDRTFSKSVGHAGSLVALLLATVLPATAGVASADPALTVTNVTVSTEQPAPGQLTEVRTTVRNAGNRSGVVEITDVYVRPKGGSGDRARAEDIGTVAGGQSLTVPLTLTFDDPGVKDLRVHVVGRTPNGCRTPGCVRRSNSPCATRSRARPAR
ncbi:MAG: hypothetical protein V5A62_04765 [Haloarculaceae archaeon]